MLPPMRLSLAERWRQNVTEAWHDATSRSHLPLLHDSTTTVSDGMHWCDQWDEAFQKAWSVLGGGHWPVADESIPTSPSKLATRKSPTRWVPQLQSQPIVPSVTPTTQLALPCLSPRGKFTPISTCPNPTRLLPAVCVDSPAAAVRSFLRHAAATAPPSPHFRKAYTVASPEETPAAQALHRWPLSPFRRALPRSYAGTCLHSGATSVVRSKQHVVVAEETKSVNDDNRREGTGGDGRLCGHVADDRGPRNAMAETVAQLCCLPSAATLPDARSNRGSLLPASPLPGPGRSLGQVVRARPGQSLFSLLVAHPPLTLFELEDGDYPVSDPPDASRLCIAYPACFIALRPEAARLTGDVIINTIGVYFEGVSFTSRGKAALWCRSGETYLSGCRLTNTDRIAGVGARLSGCARLVLSNSTICGCAGGGVLAAERSQITIDRCRFDGCERIIPTTITTPLITASAMYAGDGSNEGTGTNSEGEDLPRAQVVVRDQARLVMRRTSVRHGPSHGVWIATRLLSLLEVRDGDENGSTECPKRDGNPYSLRLSHGRSPLPSPPLRSPLASDVVSGSPPLALIECCDVAHHAGWGIVFAGHRSAHALDDAMPPSVVCGSLARANGRGGILLTGGCDGVTLRGNDVFANGGPGVSLDGCSSAPRGVLIAGNRLHDGRDCGLSCSDCGMPCIDANTTWANVRAGLVLAGAACEAIVRRNRFTDGVEAMCLARGQLEENAIWAPPGGRMPISCRAGAVPIIGPSNRVHTDESSPAPPDNPVAEASLVFAEAFDRRRTDGWRG